MAESTSVFTTESQLPPTGESANSVSITESTLALTAKWTPTQLAWSVIVALSIGALYTPAPIVEICLTTSVPTQLLTSLSIL